MMIMMIMNIIISIIMDIVVMITQMSIATLSSGPSSLRVFPTCLPTNVYIYIYTHRYIHI